MADFTQLEYFRTVANLQHITHAAEELHISQPNLSNVIKRLEHSLGVKLFNRRNGRIFLNEYGRIYLAAVNQAFDTLASAEKRIAELQASASKRPVVVTSSMQLYMENMVEAFLERYPNSTLKVLQEVASIEDILTGLWNGEMDAALIPSSADIPNVVSWAPVLTNRIGVLVGTAHPLAERESLTLEDLKNCPFVCNNLGIGHDLIMSFCGLGGFTPNIVFESNNSASIGQWIEKCRGISFISSYDLMTLFSSGPAPRDVKVLPILEPELTLEMGLAIVHETAEFPERQTLLDFAKQYFIMLNKEIDVFWKHYYQL